MSVKRGKSLDLDDSHYIFAINPVQKKVAPMSPRKSTLNLLERKRGSKTRPQTIRPPKNATRTHVQQHKTITALFNSAKNSPIKVLSHKMMVVDQ